jgi:hypothetical protein
MIRRRDLIKEYYYRKLFTALRQSNLNQPRADSATDCEDIARTNATTRSGYGGEVPGILYEKIDFRDVPYQRFQRSRLHVSAVENDMVDSSNHNLHSNSLLIGDTVNQIVEKLILFDSKYVVS